MKIETEIEIGHRGKIMKKKFTKHTRNDGIFRDKCKRRSDKEDFISLIVTRINDDKLNVITANSNLLFLERILGQHFKI